LNNGQSTTDTFTVTTVDGTARVVTVTINGTNDDAMNSATAKGSVSEAGGVANGTAGTPAASGTLTDSDVDNAANSFTAVPAGAAPTNGSGTYFMTAGRPPTSTLFPYTTLFRSLNNGQSTTDTFTVTTVDGTARVVT